ncbi:nickel-binding protein [Gaoshiqia sp. Z1-71]|uniref:nickel-binding protein n=1 Tax=Gaoshiqia hydrogeniformans TaxID=3290090 RepID=UPI003BF82DDF
MPIYMDRHDVSEAVTAEIVAELHQQDLKIQDQFKCRGLTYWFDENRKTAFCLIEAPNEQSIRDMHNQAHGEVPHRVIEVDARIVESFLGRIEDPEKAQNTRLNIINDPAFRIIMIMGLKKPSLKNHESHSALIRAYHQSAAELIATFDGRIVQQNEDHLLVSFKSVSKAVRCALKLQSEFHLFRAKAGKGFADLKISLNAGVPVTGKNTIFEDTIKLAERMFRATRAEIVMSHEVKDLFESENLNQFMTDEQILALTSADELFLTCLMDFTEKEWQNTFLKVADFQKHLGYSKSTLYRQMMHLTGKSPNNFIMSYRLNMALELFRKQKGNISEIAFETGFNSPSYFSKCFRKKYGLMPSGYLGAMFV